VSQGLQRAVRSAGSSMSHGISLTVRHRMAGPYSYALNYSWQQSSEFGGSPDLVAEAMVTGAAFDDRAERWSARGKSHVFQGIATMQWRESMPRALAQALGPVLRNSRTTVTAAAASGTRANRVNDVLCPPNSGCAAFTGGLTGTGTIINLLYVRTLNTTGPRTALTVRVRNLLDTDDGSRRAGVLDARRGRTLTGLPAADVGTVGLRRVLAGLSVTF
jgi:hypothetical protein